MADNIQVTQGTGTTMATDDIAGVQYPRVKVSWGVDGSAVDASASNPFPVQGTVTANAGTGSFTVAQATAANLNATVVGTGTFAVQAAQSGTWNIGNVTGTVSLPTGAATAAKQPALGTAGTPSADVLTVQGAAAMTALKVDGSAVTQPVSDGNGSLTVDNAGTFAVQATQAGTWNINNVSGTISLPTGAATDSTVSTMSGKLPATLGQKTMANSMAVVVASDQSAVPVSGTVTANAGTGNFTVAQATAANLNATVVGTGTFAVQAAQSGTWNVNNITGTVSLPTGAATETTLSGMSGKLPTTLGQKTMANSLAVAIASDQGNVPVISNNSEVRISANFTRPADTTAYAAGDLVANSTSSGSVVPLSFTNAVRSAGDCVRIERVRIEKSGTSLTNASFRLHLFEASPTPTVGDNGVFNNAGVLASNNVLNYVGAFPVTMTNSGSDGATGFGVPATGAGVTCSPTSGTTLYGFLEATAAYTPANAEVFYVVIEGYRT